VKNNIERQQEHREASHWHEDCDPKPVVVFHTLVVGHLAAGAVAVCTQLFINVVGAVRHKIATEAIAALARKRTERRYVVSELGGATDNPNGEGAKLQIFPGCTLKEGD
jgi:hypothetical protein